MKIPVKYSVSARYERGCPFPIEWEVVETWSGGENRYPFKTESEARLYAKQMKLSAEHEVRKDCSFSIGCFIGAVATIIFAIVLDIALQKAFGV